MGATANYKSLTPWALDVLKGHPWLVEPFVCWQRFDLRMSPWLDTLEVPQRDEMVARITASLPPDRENGALSIWREREPEDFARVEPLLARLQTEWDRPSLDIDKAWRGILADLSHCSADAAETIRRAVSSGTVLGPNLGYAPAEYHEPKDVETLAQGLVTAQDEHATLAPFYARELGYVRDYYLDASRHGWAMLLFLA